MEPHEQNSPKKRHITPSDEAMELAEFLYSLYEKQKEHEENREFTKTISPANNKNMNKTLKE